MLLIHRPFKFLNEFGPSQGTVLAEFCNNFLRPPMTHNVKYHLIPYLKDKADSSYYDKLIRYLNSIYYLMQSNSLFYCMLALEPVDYGNNNVIIGCIVFFCLNFFRTKCWQHSSVLVAQQKSVHPKTLARFDRRQWLWGRGRHGHIRRRNTTFRLPKYHEWFEQS